MEIHKYGQDMLYLIFCALRGCEPETDRVDDMDLDNLYKYCRWQTLDSITYSALASMKKLPEAEVLKRWKERYLKAMRKNMMLDSQRDKLFAFMDEKHIWHMPLKGVVLKALYPNASMRQMADNDILFDKTFQAQVKDYFVDQGYKVISYARGNHDVYEKEPVYNFEMHTSLFGSGHKQEWFEYYQNVKERLVRDAKGYGFHFTDEDFYIYFITHAYKHFDGHGTGVRYFVDCYVYQHKKTLDWDYIEKELEVLGVSEFERAIRGASKKIFSENVFVPEILSTLTEEEYMLLSESVGSGTYGTMEKGVKKKLRKLQADNQRFKKITKLRYYMHRLFPCSKEFVDCYPLIYKSVILVPFFWIYRMFRGAFRDRKRLSKEAKVVHDSKE